MAHSKEELDVMLKDGLVRADSEHVLLAWAVKLNVLLHMQCPLAFFVRTRRAIPILVLVGKDGSEAYCSNSAI